MLGLMWAGRAEAAPFTPELETDYAYAEQWWGATPAGCSSVQREVVSRAELGGNAGMATQPLPGAAPVPCTMRIAEGQPSACYARETVLHEYGHLLGYGHSEDPTSIMYPEGTGACDAELLAQEIANLRSSMLRMRVRCLRLVAVPRRAQCRANERELRRLIGELRRDAASA
jgi:hypothetical protein